MVLVEFYQHFAQRYISRNQVGPDGNFEKFFLGVIDDAIIDNLVKSWVAGAVRNRRFLLRVADFLLFRIEEISFDVRLRGRVGVF